MKKAFYLLTISAFVLAGAAANAQENVGIGTLSPNPKALLDLWSTSKGVLLPRMTTAQRIAIGPSVGALEASLTVFDTDSSLFYFWNGAEWKHFPSKPGDHGWKILGSNLYSIVPGNVGIGVPTSTPLAAKLHTQGAVRFSLLDSTTSQIRVLTVDNVGNVRTRSLDNDVWDGDSVNDADSDPSNECVTSVNYDPGTQLLTIGRCGGVISTSIPVNANDNDQSPTNEIQNLSSSATGSTVTISISGGGNSTSFNNDDADASATNEIQQLSFNKNGVDINWSLTNGGGSGTFTVDDNDWTGAGTGNLYPTTLTDRVGIGTSTPAHRLDVTGDARVTGKQYFNTTDYYIENNSTNLRIYSANNMRIEAGTNDHLLTFTKSGAEALATFNLDGTDVVTMRGNGTYNYGVGIGTSTPSDKLQVAGNVRVGLINAPGFTNGGSNYGEQLYFSGGPGYAGGFNSDNDDLLFIARYNESADVTELRIGVGDDQNSSSANLDRLSIGSVTPGGGINSFEGLFQFDIENPNSSNGPMLSISPRGFLHAKNYHGGVSISKPLGSNGQYINLARTDAGNVLNVWSLGYDFGTANFGIGQGQTNDAAFNAPAMVILAGSGFVGIGIDNPSNRLELPTVAGSTGTGLAHTWSSASDGRFKKNREDIGTVLPKVMQLNPLYYHWENFQRDKEGRVATLGLSDQRELGFIAQDVFEIFPEVVQKPKDESTEIWSMDYARLTTILTKAVQEQQDMLQAERDAHQETKAELQSLKAEVEQLRGDVSKINMLLGKKTEASIKAPNN